MSKTNPTSLHKHACPILFTWLLVLTIVCLGGVKLQHTTALNHSPTSVARLMLKQAPSALPACKDRQSLNGLNPEAASVLEKYFPQSQQCGDSWRQQYAQLHHEILSAKRPPRYLTSVAVQTGLGDRVTGLVTQFYLALLSKRAFTMVTYGDLPPFESACDASYINFTHPTNFPDDALGPAKTIWSGPRAYPGNGLINSSMYHVLYLTNQPAETLDMFKYSNLSEYPPANPDVPYVLSSSNRGHTHYLMHNPYHKQELASYGLRPETAFMCGWFTICAPNKAVQALYSHYWQALSEPGVLRIGIQVRLGDDVFGQQTGDLGEAQLAIAEPYFRCAETVEKAFVTPGQKVLWYLISDALPLRVAAKSKFGDKLLTDTAIATQHVDCRTFNPESCSKDAMDLSIQHSIGQLLTLSLADFHIITKESGFGRMGAWMSGKYGNLYEFDVVEKWGMPPPNFTVACNPYKPTSHETSSRTWAQV